MVSKKETVSIQIEEVLPMLIDTIKEAFGDLPSGTKFIYTSKTTFLTFDIIRPDVKTDVEYSGKVTVDVSSYTEKGV